MPRNGKHRNSSLSRKASLPITPSKKPPPPPTRKAPLPPPRPFQRQATAPALHSPGMGTDVSTTIVEVPEKQVKPFVPPRKMSDGDNIKSELEQKLSSCPSHQEQEQSGKVVLKEGQPEHFSQTKNRCNISNRDSMDDDVFPPPPLDIFKEESLKESPNKKTITKPPRHSLIKKNKQDKAIVEDEVQKPTPEPPPAEKRPPIPAHPEKRTTEPPPVVKRPPIPTPPEKRSPVLTPQEQSTLSTPLVTKPTPVLPTDKTPPAVPPTAAKPFSVPPLPARAAPVPPPITKPKPAVKRKPKLPPRPPAKPGSSANDDEHDQCDVWMSQDQGSSLDVPEFPVPRKRPSHSLSDLIDRRLRIEQIDLTDTPYSNQVCIAATYISIMRLHYQFIMTASCQTIYI